MDSEFPTQLKVKMKDLPKSFGCEVLLNPGYENR